MDLTTQVACAFALEQTTLTPRRSHRLMHSHTGIAAANQASPSSWAANRYRSRQRPSVSCGESDQEGKKYGFQLVRWGLLDSRTALWASAHEVKFKRLLSTVRVEELTETP